MTCPVAAADTHAPLIIVSIITITREVFCLHASTMALIKPLPRTNLAENGIAIAATSPHLWIIIMATTLAQINKECMRDGTSRAWETSAHTHVRHIYPLLLFFFSHMRLMKGNFSSSNTTKLIILHRITLYHWMSQCPHVKLVPLTLSQCYSYGPAMLPMLQSAGVASPSSPQSWEGNMGRRIRWFLYIWYTSFAL